MSDFVIQYAIRLPNGALYCRPKASAYNTMAYMFGATAREPQRELAVFDDRADVEKLLNDMREMAAEVGVDNLGCCIVQRLCSPFTSDDPGDEFAAAVIEWVARQGNS
jgi:hypothetical protein